MTKRHWYKYKFRGLSVGCQPKDFVSYDMLIGKFGAMAYEWELTEEEETRKYELELVKDAREHLSISK
jgi:hypothetical protein